MVNSLEDVVKLIMRRDRLSLMEAQEAVNDCMDELESAVTNGYYEEADSILRNYLGLEPDYLDVFINAMF